MSLAEIKEEIPKLSYRDRVDLCSFIGALNANDPEYAKELDRRFERMERGEKVSADKVYAIHDGISSKGK